MLLRKLPTKKIFISYRVHDTAGETGRLVDALKQHFADDQIFMDIENLEPGADFTEAIERSLSTCDVFLAVIGPQWLGNREGDLRINNPNDWVRLEVATALRRNVRVVPVLVDGGSLPAAEQLPEDLQPLLRRQTIEISNKRWRYDTDQLINFLVNTAGITPKKAALQNPSSAKSTKRRTWLYVAGGFVLAIVVLSVIAPLVQDEKKDGAAPQTETVGNRQDDYTTTNQTAVPTNSGAEANQTAGNVTGTWDEVNEMDEGQTTILFLTQSGSQLTAEAQAAGQTIGSGTGEIAGQNVELNLTLLGVAYSLRLTLSGDGNTLSGTYYVPATGLTQQEKLVRRR